METKLFEIRDEGTLIPALAIRLNSQTEQERYLLARCGYGLTYIILCKLDGVRAQYDPYEWTGGRTLKEAHRFILAHWQSLTTGDVIDVQFILGETQTKKVSENPIGGNS